MRLNKEIREKIVENAYKASSIPADKKALTERSMALAEKIRLASFGPYGDLTDKFKALEAEFKLLLSKRDIPDGYDIETTMRPKSNQVYCKLGESFEHIRFDGQIGQYVDGNYVYVPPGKCDSKIKGHLDSKELRFDANHEFTQEYRAILNTALELDSKEKTLRNTVRAAVESFKTVEKLIEEWPEAKALIPKEIEAASKPMSLALQTQTLNELIGLPK